jgi:non-specific serine/threonine protein kinase
LGSVGAEERERLVRSAEGVPAELRADLERLAAGARCPAAPQVSRTDEVAVAGPAPTPVENDAPREARPSPAVELREIERWPIPPAAAPPQRLGLASVAASLVESAREIGRSLQAHADAGARRMLRRGRRSIGDVSHSLRASTLRAALAVLAVTAVSLGVGSTAHRMPRDAIASAPPALLASAVLPADPPDTEPDRAADVATRPPPAPTPAPAPEPAPEPVRVQVNARPWAQIRVNGVDVGATPLGNLQLAPGYHDFEATFGDGRVVTRRVEIGAEQRFVSLR